MEGVQVDGREVAIVNGEGRASLLCGNLDFIMRQWGVSQHRLFCLQLAEIQAQFV